MGVDGRGRAWPAWCGRRHGGRLGGDRNVQGAERCCQGSRQNVTVRSGLPGCISACSVGDAELTGGLINLIKVRLLQRCHDRGNTITNVLRVASLPLAPLNGSGFDTLRLVIPWLYSLARCSHSLSRQIETSRADQRDICGSEGIVSSPWSLVTTTLLDNSGEPSKATRLSITPSETMGITQ